MNSSDSDDDLPLALTMGEPAGVGPDITLAAWLGRKEHNIPPFYYIGCPRGLADRGRQLGLEVPLMELKTPQDAAGAFAHNLPVSPLNCVEAVPGRPSIATAGTVIQAIETAVHHTQSGQARAVVTNPIAKSVLNKAGFEHPGHTEFLESLSRSTDRRPNPKAVMMLACDTLKAVPVTIHIPLAKVPGAISEDLIVMVSEIVSADLTTRFGFDCPQIVVSGLNPHAGEDGLMGREETDIIEPAIARLKTAGIDAAGPCPADSMFHERARAQYDAAICMYHDQALIPIKTLAFESAVNVTLGLDFIRTSPDHGTAFDIAGTGKARETSLIAALKTAAEMAKTESRHGD